MKIYTISVEDKFGRKKDIAIFSSYEKAKYSLMRPTGLGKYTLHIVLGFWKLKVSIPIRQVRTYVPDSEEPVRAYRNKAM